MANVGKLEDFDPDTDSWDVYCERLALYLEAKAIDDNSMKRAILLTEMGKKSYTLLRNLCAPAKPVEKTYGELIRIMKAHQHPTPSVIVERLRFNKRDRAQGETIASYVSELRRLACTCDFGANLDSALRDRLVCGVNHDAIQKRLLAEKQLDYPKALGIAQGLEMAEKNVKDMKFDSGRVNRVDSSHSRPRKPNNPNQKNSTKTSSQCDRCGRAGHAGPDCYHKSTVCNKCNKIGHLARVCRSGSSSSNSSGHQQYRKGGKGRRSQGNATHNVTVDGAGGEEPEVSEVYDLFKVNLQLHSQKVEPYLVDISLDGSPLLMEIDTGAARSVISETVYRQLWKNPPPLQPSSAILRTYTGERVPILGTADLNVAYEKQSANVSVMIVEGKTPSLLGRDWLQHLKLDWGSIFRLDNSDLQDILRENSEVFSSNLGEMKDIKVSIDVSVPATPRFYKHRNVAYAMKEKVEKELDRLETEGVIRSVKHSEWAAPIVPVLKANQSVRICGDYKLTVNQVAKPDIYPIPRIEDLFASLSGGKTFTKLDLSNAYQQLVLDEPSRKLTTINTHRGLYEYCRMPFGISAAPSIFQRTIECLLQNIPHVCVYLDDILITGVHEAEHLANLKEVLSRINQAGLKLRAEKCQFQQDAVEYLGHRIDKDGLHPLDGKVKAIVSAPSPKNTTELKSFLGMVQYYQRFLPNLATTLAPLHRLLRKEVCWSWSAREQEAFDRVKHHLSSCKLLVHYNPSLTLTLACDASPYGVGAVLSHIMENGEERPVAFASRSLAPAERNYSQLDKEALAIVFGVKRFSQYLLGRKFEILSDHKPLMSLLSAEKATPPMASARLQRWALTLAAYDYTITYRPGSKLANADCLSRLPLIGNVSDPPVPGETIMLLENFENFPIQVAQIRTWTARDPCLSRVKKLVQSGFPEHLKSEDSMKPFIRRKDELSVQDGILLWGNRVVVPPPGRTQVIEQLHEAHPGIARMKALARGLVWWPGIDSDLEEKVKLCNTCQQSRAVPTSAKLHPWEWPERPWSRLHIDYAGPLQGKMFLIVIDAHSKWLEVFPVHSATSSATIECLRNAFATHGIPETIVSDNGSCFTSDEFAQFVRRNGIEHICVAPYHPSSNGMAERAVQTFKSGFLKMSGGSIETRISRFLFRYRNTPQGTTGSSPAELLFGRRPRSHLDLLHPDVARRVHHKQQKQVEHHDCHAKDRVIKVNDPVYIQNFASGEKWLSGIIVEKTGPVSFRVRLQDGRFVRRHVDHVRYRHTADGDKISVDSEEKVEANPVVLPIPEVDSPPVPFSEVILPPMSESTRCVPDPGYTMQNSPSPEPPDLLIPISASPGTQRRSGRSTRAPDRLNL